MLRRSLSAAILATAFLASGTAAGDDPARPPAERPLVLGGEISGTISPTDHSAYFNHSDYGRNALREARISLAAEARMGRHLRVLGEVRTENFSTPRVYALYLRVRPWVDRSFDVQAGMIPPVFGRFPRMRYGLDNPLIGMPLGYQYLTTVRTDAAPASADDILRMRGGGWRVRYPVGSGEWEQGLPVVSARRWDTGVQARWRVRQVEVAAALTQGSLASPRVDDDNDGKHVSGRVAWLPQPGLILGASASDGAYLSDDVERLLPAGRSYRQTAWGADLEYSRGYWLARAEAIWTGWDSPVWSTPLKARALSAEGRYKVMAGAWVATRVEHLGFSNVAGNTGWGPWDAPVWRVETGAGYSLRRNLILKAAWQYNWRDGGRIQRKGLAAAQVLCWF